MQASKRLIFQSFIWLIFWSVLWVEQPSFLFIQRNITAYIFQVLLITGLIYYFAPKILFRKKYLLFGIISLFLIFICAYFASYGGRMPRPGPPGPGGGRLKPPPIYMVHFLSLMISYTIATFIETFVFAQKKEKETIKSKNENLQTELKFLKSQINPHFLFNSLNNIYALSVIDSNKTQASISYLSDMLRYVVYECEQKWVPIKKELTYIENYIKLFSLKSSKKYPIHLNFNIDNENLMVAPMLFIPFVENAFKHSNIDQIEDTYVNINIKSTNQDVYFEVVNSVPKLRVLKDKVGGIGIENVKRRLEILYPNKYELTINKRESVFKVQLNLRVYEKIKLLNS